MRVLLVDESGNPHQPVLKQLHALGHTAELAGTFDSAVGLLHSFAPTVVAIRAVASRDDYDHLAEVIKQTCTPPPSVVVLGEFVSSEHIDLWLMRDEDFLEIAHLFDQDRPAG